MPEFSPAALAALQAVSPLKDEGGSFEERRLVRITDEWWAVAVKPWKEGDTCVVRLPSPDGGNPKYEARVVKKVLPHWAILDDTAVSRRNVIGRVVAWITEVENRG